MHPYGYQPHGFPPTSWPTQSFALPRAPTPMQPAPRGDLHPPQAAVAEQAPMPTQEKATTVSLNELTTAIDELSTELQKKLIAELEAQIPINSLVLEPQQVQMMRSKLEAAQRKRFLPTLAVIAKKYAECPVTKHAVGVAAMGKSGALYLGHNVEFDSCSPTSYIHAISILLLNMGAHGETTLVEIALSDDLSGPEIALLNECSWPSNCKVHIPGKEPVLITTLLKHARSSEKLDFSNMMKVQKLRAEPSEEDYPLGAAQAAAQHSYTPLTKTESGVALVTTDGKVYPGSTIETHAYTCIGPLQTALALFRGQGNSYDTIKEVVLAEKIKHNVSQEAETRAIMKAIAPHITVRREEF